MQVAGERQTALYQRTLVNRLARRQGASDKALMRLLRIQSTFNGLDHQRVRAGAQRFSS